jgi:hypothetical protein
VMSHDSVEKGTATSRVSLMSGSSRGLGRNSGIGSEDS